MAVRRVSTYNTHPYSEPLGSLTENKQGFLLCLPFNLEVVRFFFFSDSGEQAIGPHFPRVTKSHVDSNTLWQGSFQQTNL